MKSLTTLEGKTHGNPLFPLATYSMKFPEDSEILDLHWHSELEFLVVTKGVGLFYLNDREYRVKSGDALIIPGGSLHRGYTERGYACNFTAVVFDPRLLSQEDDIIYLKYYKTVLENLEYLNPLFYSNKYEGLISQFLDLHRINKQRGETYELDLKIRLMEIFKGLFYIASEYDHQTKNTNGQFSYIKEVLSFIHNNYNKELRVIDIAKRAGFSEAHFSRTFRSIVGKTIMDYINDYRINMAMDLLKNSDKAIGLIAELTGFESSSYFIKKFRECSGSTPGKFRKSLNKV